MQLVGRALPIKLHSQVEVARTDEEQQALKAKWEAGGRAPAETHDGSYRCTRGRNGTLL
jgi:hypothetical protein